VRLILLTALAVAAMAASVMYASDVEQETARTHGLETALTLRALSDFNRADAALSAFALTGDDEALEDRGEALTALRQTLAEAREAASDDEIESAAVVEQQRTFEQFATRVAAQLAAPTPARRRAELTADTDAREALAERFAQANERLADRQGVLAEREDRSASYVSPLVIIVLGLLFGAAAAVTLARSARERRRDDRAHAQGERFSEAMQVAEDQREAHGLLKAHLERTLPGAEITVLNRNNSADRLEASTPLDETGALAARLQDARPRSCLSMRLNRPFTQGGASDEVLSCEICGVLPGQATCQPLQVGGEVIGAVLAGHDAPLSDRADAQIASSVAQAAPVLANLRNLAIAEMRAATDSLTGLPNRRSVDDTLLRMLAQAGRSFTPLSAILLDLDHFKQINDTYGHDKGDEVLAAFATRLREVLRASDFAGRSGGEEFVLLLPDTDRTGAVRLAEKVREVMRGLSVAGLERDITASFGVACFPDDAVDAASLLRRADRALYAAKRNGRNRIESTSSGATGEPAFAEQP
jgi:diguanylate cyclase (GGDEF)-like protein